MIKVVPVDRYLYLGTLYYLTSVYLRKIGTLHFLLPRKRLLIRGVYANINTKYFLGTLDVATTKPGHTRLADPNRNPGTPCISH